MGGGAIAGAVIGSLLGALVVGYAVMHRRQLLGSPVMKRLNDAVPGPSRGNVQGGPGTVVSVGASGLDRDI